MKLRNFIAILMMICFTFLFAPFQQKGHCAEKISFAVIFLGGPDTGVEGDKIITQFMDSLSKLSSMKKDSLQGKYFNNISDAKTYIQQNKNSYVMGSIAFYLANRKSMNLSPLAVVKIQGNAVERYYLVVKKGHYKSMEELKGKTLSGNILYEDKTFINKMIFNDKIDISDHFKLKPTNRPLSAVKKLIRGEFDAILLNHMQYTSLKNLAEFNKIQILHESPKMPALGLMMVNTGKNNAAKGTIVSSVTRMCNQNDTKDACKNFGIEGFESIETEMLSNEIKKYENAR